LTYDLTGKGRDLVKALFADYGGALESGLAVRAGFKKGNTRGEFWLPFIDYNGNFVPDFGTREMFIVDLLGHYPTPDDILMMIAVGQAEQKALEAIYGVGKVPWDKYTYPGWFYLSFTGPPLGKLTQGKDPADFLADDYAPERVREITLGYERMLGTDISLQFLLAYKKEYNITWARGYYGTKSSYTLMPIEINKMVGTDPVTGWDIYQRDPAIANPAGYILNNYKNTYNDFKGVQFIFTKKLTRGWMMQASVDLQDWKSHTAKSEVGMSTLFDYYDNTPYQAFQFRSTEPGQNAKWHFKISGLVQLPFGVNLSGFIDARQGYPINGMWINSYLGQTLPKKGDKYGDYRMPNLWWANMTLEKPFRFSENITGTVYVTGYNITDNMTTTMINESKVPTTLNQPTDIMKPRIFQLGVRFNFR
jgi:hypothetical protein